MNASDLTIRRAAVENAEKMLQIIHRCLIEVNSYSYTPEQLSRYKARMNREWLLDLIQNRHYYEVWRGTELVACGGVSRDYSQQRQSYYSAIFVCPDYRGQGIGKALIRWLEENDDWCLDSTLIEVPSSKSSHGFYHKLGYSYRTEPPVFSEEDGSTIMYKYFER